MDNFEDVVENLTFLYIMSKTVDYNSHPVKRIEIPKEDGFALTGEFFRKLSNNNDEIFSALKRYIYSLKEVPWVEGGLFINEKGETRILAPTQDNIFSTSILIHECTHALDIEKIINLEAREGFEEVLPFLNQFLFIDYLKEFYDVDELKNTHMDYMINNQLLYNVNEYVNLSDKVIIDPERMKSHFKYILGSLYSIVLYEWYKADEDFMNRYSKIYTENAPLNSLTDYYDVKLGDIENIKLVKSLMKK